jgi:NADPH-dependent ferric siderophore reductase
MVESTRIRREPPPFRTVTVRNTESITTWMKRITLASPALVDMAVAEPASSVRVLLPGPSGLVIPEWSGNEFLLPDDTRPVIRTLTPRYQRENELDIDVVLHATGATSNWARTVAPGDEVAVSGPGRGSAPDPDGSHVVLAGDESAVPAIAQLLEVMAPRDRIEVFIETATPGDPAPLSERGDTSVRWIPASAEAPPGSALVDAVRDVDLSDNTRVWAAGEAAAMQQIRRYLQGLEVPRSHTTVRGYWKHGKVAGGVG